MVQRVLIIGGQGRIGRSVALDLLPQTEAQVTLTGRTMGSPNLSSSVLQRYGDRVNVVPLNLEEASNVERIIANHDLVVHCAGPFRQRDVNVLESCIEQGVQYLDVSDDREYTVKALNLQEKAQAKGVVAVINSGVFPGISNSMVRLGAEQLDTLDQIHLSYVVAGSGGAGVTVLRTTFLNIQTPFNAWIQGKWREVKPYTEREVIEFPEPLGATGVYWFDMPETLTLVNSFPVNTVVTKFGSAPDFYNRMTSLVAHWFPKRLMQQPQALEALAQVSYKMTSVTDRWSGNGVAIQAEIIGTQNNKSAFCRVSMIHDNAAIATGLGTGSIAQYLLSGQIQRSGVWPVEQVLSTELFMESMNSRGISLQIEKSF
jgi:saccharopine dehydrogenase-like NADP-dependent oxidoreductase